MTEFNIGDTVQVTSGAMAPVSDIVYLYEKTGKYLVRTGAAHRTTLPRTRSSCSTLESILTETRPHTPQNAFPHSSILLSGAAYAPLSSQHSRSSDSSVRAIRVSTSHLPPIVAPFSESVLGDVDPISGQHSHPRPCLTSVSADSVPCCAEMAFQFCDHILRQFRIGSAPFPALDDHPLLRIACIRTPHSWPMINSRSSRTTVSISTCPHDVSVGPENRHVRPQ